MREKETRLAVSVDSGNELKHLRGAMLENRKKDYLLCHRSKKKLQIDLLSLQRMEIIDRDPHEVRERSDEFLLTWGMCLLTDRSILPAERHAAAYAVLRQHIMDKDGETEFHKRAVFVVLRLSALL